MRLTQKEIDEIKNFSLVLDFIEITLAQQCEGSPVIYKGPGTISQKKDGSLKLKMYYKYESSDHVNRDSFSSLTNSLTPGEIIKEENYFYFSAIDFSGRRWESANIWLDKIISHITHSSVFEADLNSIYTKGKHSRKVDNNRSFIYTLIPGEFLIPCNDFEKLENQQVRSLCKIRLNNGVSTIRKRDEYVELEAELHDVENSEQYLQKVLEAISIAIGDYLTPNVIAFSHLDENLITIKGARIDKNRKRKLHPPFSIHKPSDVEFLSEFVNRYVLTFDLPYSTFFGYWYRIFSGMLGDLENQALVLTTSIEGILKNYFKEYGRPDHDFIEEVSKSLPYINELRIDERVKNRIIQNLENAKSLLPKNALFSMADKKIIKKELAKTWVSLRNISAHAAEINKNETELQRYLNQIDSCYELFYFLLLHYIEYEGVRYEYSIRGWPVAHLVKN